MIRRDERTDNQIGADDRPLVLVVDDEDSVRECLELILEDDGYRVLTACHGAAALGLLSDHQPDVVILDMQMPVMDGPAFAGAYRQLPGPHAPIILLTASALGPVIAAELGAAAFVAKPFDLQTLLTRVDLCV